MQRGSHQRVARVASRGGICLSVCSAAVARAEASREGEGVSLNVHTSSGPTSGPSAVSLVARLSAGLCGVLGRAAGYCARRMDAGGEGGVAAAVSGR